MKPNASAFDSAIYADIFSSQPMREIWSDETRIQRYLDFERALAKVQAGIGIIPKAAADEIARHCRTEEIDFGELKKATEHIGYPVLPVIEQLVALCTNGLGQ